MGLEEELVEGGGGDVVGSCGRGTGTAFLSIAPALPGGGTMCSQLRYSKTAGKHLAQHWECPVCGSALFNLIFRAPGCLLGRGTGLFTARGACLTVAGAGAGSWGQNQQPFPPPITI